MDWGAARSSPFSSKERKSFELGDLLSSSIDNAELLTFNREHFGQVPGLRLARG